MATREITFLQRCGLVDIARSGIRQIGNKLIQSVEAVLDKQQECQELFENKLRN